MLSKQVPGPWRVSDLRGRGGRTESDAYGWKVTMTVYQDFTGTP
jgi:hypothetical protein